MNFRLISQCLILCVIFCGESPLFAMQANNDLEGLGRPFYCKLERCAQAICQFFYGIKERVYDNEVSFSNPLSFDQEIILLRWVPYTGVATLLLFINGQMANVFYRGMWLSPWKCFASASTIALLLSATLYKPYSKFKLDYREHLISLALTTENQIADQIAKWHTDCSEPMFGPSREQALIEISEEVKNLDLKKAQLIFMFFTRDSSSYFEMLLPEIKTLLIKLLMDLRENSSTH